MRKLLLACAIGVATVAVPTTAYARTGASTTCKASFTAHPENSSPPWALDTFTRTTRIKPAGDGKWAVHIVDRGHFTTIPGVKSDSGDTIQNKVTGTFRGSGDYTVTSTTGPACVSGESYNGTNDPATSDWPKHYFAAGATTTGIDPWSWLYRTCREYMVEDSVKGTVGHIAGKACKTKPSPTPTPTETSSTPSPTDNPGGGSEPGEAPKPTPVKSDLPVTG